MWELVDGSSNNAVSIKEIHRFGRMKNYQPYEAVVSALRESTFFEVSGEEGAETIQRKRPYDPQFVKDKETRQKHTVYAKGFGDEKPSSQFDIEAFFANYGATNEVRLRRDEAKFFKSSVFVEFTDAADAEKFVTLEPKPTFEGNELKIMSKSAYEEEKIQLIRDGKMEPNTTRLTSFYGPRASRGRGRGDGFKGGRERRDRDPNDWKKRREDDQASGFKNDRRGGGRGGRRGGRDGRDDKGPQDRNQEREFKKEM
jgi:lupus La protein